MKGFLFKLVVLGFIILVATNYMGYQQSGIVPARDWLVKVQSVVAPAVRNTVNKLTNAESSATNDTVKVSKWTDAKGIVHYENRPVDGAQTLEVDPDTNVLPPMPIVELPKSGEAKPAAKTTDQETHATQEAKRAYMDALTQ